MRNISSIKPSPFTSSYRNQLIESYSELVADLQNRGMEAYYFSFMFDHISGNESQRKERMLSDVRRVHDILSRHIVRKPTSKAWEYLLPVFIVCPDFPVPKAEKGNIRAYNSNDGLHMNGIGLVPPPPPSWLPPGVRQHPSLGKLSRLREPLDVHFHKVNHEYVTDKLYRIDVTHMSRGNMTDYALKNFKSGKVGYDDIRVF